MTSNLEETLVKMYLQLKRTWGAIRWKMLVIFVFFSIISMILVGCLAVALLNVVIRRESAYLLEERIKMIVYERTELIDSVKDGVSACSEPRPNSLQSLGQQDGVRPRINVMVLPWSESGKSIPGTIQAFLPASSPTAANLRSDLSAGSNVRDVL